MFLRYYSRVITQGFLDVSSLVGTGRKNAEFPALGYVFHGLITYPPPHTCQLIQREKYINFSSFFAKNRIFSSHPWLNKSDKKYRVTTAFIMTIART